MPAIVYKNKEGVRLPSVTTITGILSKRALLVWANNIGLQGIIMKDYVDNLADIGTLAHHMVSSRIKKAEPVFDKYSSEQIELAKQCYLKYVVWESRNNVEYIDSELSLISEKHGFGGTLDIPMVLNGKKTLVDLKTGKAVYDDYFLQVAGGYLLLSDENSLGIESSAILRIGRTEDEGIEAEFKPIENQDLWQKLFLQCLDVYKTKKELKFN